MRGTSYPKGQFAHFSSNSNSSCFPRKLQGSTASCVLWSVSEVTTSEKPLCKMCWCSVIAVRRGTCGKWPEESCNIKMLLSSCCPVQPQGCIPGLLGCKQLTPPRGNPVFLLLIKRLKMWTSWPQPWSCMAALLLCSSSSVENTEGFECNAGKAWILQPLHGEL